MIRSSKLQQLAGTGFITPEQAAYLEECLARKENIIVAGHKGHGILVLLATLMTAIPAEYKIKQVKNVSADLDEEADYYLLGDLKDKDYGQLLTQLFRKKDAAVLTIKDPDHNYALMKIIKDVVQETNDFGNAYVVVECKKVNEEKKVVKITRMAYDEKGKLVKEEVFK